MPNATGVLRGFRQRIVYIYNPNPTGVTEAQLLNAKGLDMIEPKKLSAGNPFEFRWKYGFGVEREYVVIPPGQALPLREHEVSEILQQLREQGGVMIVDVSDDLEVARARVQGLIQSYKFWSERGKPVLQNIRRLNKFTREDMEEDRHTYWPYLINEERARIIKVLLETSREELAALEAEALENPVIEEDPAGHPRTVEVA